MGTVKNIAMPGGFTIELKGLNEVLAKLDVKKFEKVIEEEIHDFGLNVKADAINNISLNGTTDEGKLVGSIFAVPEKMAVHIGASASYAGYIEFGTRKFAAAYVSSLPQDWKAYAATMKGKGGGNMDQFIQAIMAWVQRKGIGALKTKSGNNSTSAASYDAMQQAAYWIALNILRNGIKAQPFLFPAFEKNRIQLIKNLKSLLNA